MTTQLVATTIERLDFDLDIQCDVKACVHYGTEHTAHWWFKTICDCHEVIPMCDDEYRRMENFFAANTGIILYLSCKKCPWTGPVTMDSLILGPIR